MIGFEENWRTSSRSGKLNTVPPNSPWLDGMTIDRPKAPLPIQEYTGW